MQWFYRIFLVLFTLSAPVAADQCFPTNDLTPVYAHNATTFRIIQATTCPATNGAASNYFVQTHCVSTNLAPAQTSVWTGSVQRARIWANRSMGGPVTAKPNPPDGPRIMVDDGVHGSFPCFNAFSTIPIADASTLSKIAYTIGRFTTHNGKGWRDYTRAVGIADDHVLEWAAFTTQAPQICTGFYTDSTGSFYYSTDYVVEPSAKLSTVPTTPKDLVEIDLEYHDGHTDAQTKALIGAIVQNTHAVGYNFGVYTNPLNGPLQVYNGIDIADADWIVAKDDETTVYPINNGGQTYLQSFNNQMALLTTPNCSKLNMTFDGQMQPSDARDLRAAMTASGCTFGGIEMFYDGAVVGSSCDTTWEQDFEILLGIAS